MPNSRRMKIRRMNVRGRPAIGVNIWISLVVSYIYELTNKISHRLRDIFDFLLFHCKQARVEETGWMRNQSNEIVRYKKYIRHFKFVCFSFYVARISHRSRILRFVSLNESEPIRLTRFVFFVLLTRAGPRPFGVDKRLETKYLRVI